MSHLLRRVALPVPAEEAFAWHTRPGAFERLVAPWQDVRVIDRQGTVHDGDVLTMALHMGPARVKWVARHEGFEPGRSFTDVQVRGPFAAWRHTHRCLPADGGSVLEDDIQYRVPLGILGEAVAGRAIRSDLERLFTFRHERTMSDLRRHADFAGAPPLRIAITGASGLIGTALSAFLTTGGHTVLPLVRRTADPARGEIAWYPEEGRIDAQALEGVDAVIHLAGENLGGGPWTAARKARVMDSRVQGTRLIARTLAGLSRPPKVLVSASAIGIYGDRGAELLDEGSAPGDLFISEVCRAWEAEAAPAEDAGIRVVHPRIGVVLTPAGGALKPMLLPFKLGLGGPLGSGEQYLSWVAPDDVVGALHRAVLDPGLSGPVNVVAPEPVPQRELARTLGEVLGRPAVLPAPAFAIRGLMGQMGVELALAGQRVIPKRLIQAGFQFRFTRLADCLRFELGR